MKLVVNGEEREIDPSEYENFGKLLEELESEFKNHVLSKLTINGNDIPLSRVEELKNAVIDDGVEEIIIEYKPLREFLIDTLTDVVKYIDNVMELLPKVSENIITGEGGYDNVKDITEGLEAVESLRKSTIRVSGFTPKDVMVDSREDEVVGILKSFVDSLESRDIIELSDLIENELPKVFTYYREYFSRVLERLKERES